MAQKHEILLEEEFAQKRMSASLFLRMVSYLGPYRAKFILNLVFTFLATLSQLLGPKFIQIGIDRFLTNFSTAQAALRGNSDRECDLSREPGARLVSLCGAGEECHRGWPRCYERSAAGGFRSHSATLVELLRPDSSRPDYQPGCNRHRFSRSYPYLGSEPNARQCPDLGWGHHIIVAIRLAPCVWQ